MIIARVRLPWQGILKTSSIQIKTNAVWPIIAVDWLTKWLIKISDICTPARRTFRNLTIRFPYKMSSVYTCYHATVKKALLSFRNENSRRQRDSHKVYNPIESNLVNISGEREYFDFYNLQHSECWSHEFGKFGILMAVNRIHELRKNQQYNSSLSFDNITRISVVYKELTYL